MASPVTAIIRAEPSTVSATQPQSVASTATNQKATPTPAPTQSNLPIDTVQISAAAQTAVQEALETPAQTLQEAVNGDPQAARLLAQESAQRFQ